MNEVVCKVCNIKFLARLKNGCFCSKECKNIYDLKRYNEYSNSEKGKLAKEKYSKSEKRRTYIREYNRNKRKEDINFKLKEQISGAIYKQLKRAKVSKNNKHWEDVINQKFNDIFIHLEKQFDENMSWDNYGSYWQIDHIIPVSYYDLSLEEHLQKCWNINNLRPLEKTTNNKKNNKLDLILIEKYNINHLLLREEYSQ
jgi:5-methylcytosine-specific restriction endonuclease McrA